MIDPDVVRRVAGLARLGLSPEESETTITQLQGILEHFEVLGEVETEGVEPLAHAVDEPGTPGADEILVFPEPQDTLLSLTEHAREGFLVVQRILGDSDAEG